jgi:hypothetical protein
VTTEDPLLGLQWVFHILHALGLSGRYLKWELPKYGFQPIILLSSPVVAIITLCWGYQDMLVMPFEWPPDKN